MKRLSKRRLGWKMGTLRIAGLSRLLANTPACEPFSAALVRASQPDVSDKAPIELRLVGLDLEYVSANATR